MCEWIFPAGNWRQKCQRLEGNFRDIEIAVTYTDIIIRAMRIVIIWERKQTMRNDKNMVEGQRKVNKEEIKENKREVSER